MYFIPCVYLGSIIHNNLLYQHICNMYMNIAYNYYIYICRLMRRRIKVANPRIFLIPAAYMHIREEVVDEYQTITLLCEPAVSLASRRRKAAGSLGWWWRIGRFHIAACSSTIAICAIRLDFPSARRLA